MVATAPDLLTQRRAKRDALTLAAQERIDSLLAGNLTIPLLKEWGEKVVGRDLSVVPDYHLDPSTGDEDPFWRLEYFEWADDVLRVRNAIQKRCMTDLRFRQQELARCKSDPVWFILMWLYVHEPRPDEFNITDDGDIDPIKPYILFPFQIQIVYLFLAIVMMPEKHDLFISKAREIGVSYIMIAVALWSWLFRNWNGRFLSEKMEKADRSHDLDSLFVKIDMFIENIPDFFLPDGYQGKASHHRLEGMFKNPVTKAQLGAESTTARSVRGGRATYVCNDETAAQQYYKASRTSIAGASLHRVDWSTESFLMGRQWWDMWHSAKDAAKEARERGEYPRATVLELEWYRHPSKDQAWKEATMAQFRSDGNEQGFEVEYLRNPFGGYGTYVYPQAAECPLTDLGYDPNRMLMMSVDPGFEDECAWVMWQKHWEGGKKLIRWLDYFGWSRLPVEVYAHIFTGVPPEPGDTAYTYIDFFETDRRAKEAMEWFATIPPDDILLYGDPASKSTDSDASSFRLRLSLVSEELYKRRGYENHDLLITLPAETIYKRVNHPSRRYALREALMYSEFTRNEGGQQLLDAIKSVRFGEVTEKTNRPPTTRHDRYTHPTSAAEFGMLFETLEWTPDEVESIVRHEHDALAATRTPIGNARPYPKKNPYMPDDKFFEPIRAREAVAI